jgi:hypothetical protein
MLLVVRIPIESVHASHQNRSLGDEQLDDGIADTLVGRKSSNHLHGLRGHYENRTSRSKCCETQHDPHLVDFHWVVVVEFP